MKMTSALRNTTLGRAKAQSRFSAFAQFGTLVLREANRQASTKFMLDVAHIGCGPNLRAFYGPTLAIACTCSTSINRFLRLRASEPASPAA